jgi:putative membrane protein insertion efficiency factor
MDTRKIATAGPRFLIRFYQALRSGSVRRCRFYPTCSEYMLEALDAQGLLAGTAAGILRILKCHPWHPGGYDPIKGARF